MFTGSQLPGRSLIVVLMSGLVLFLCQGQGCPDVSMLPMVLDEIVDTLGVLDDDHDGDDQHDGHDDDDGHAEDDDGDGHDEDDGHHEDDGDDHDDGPDGDDDGVPDVIDSCPDTPAGAVVDQFGCHCEDEQTCDDEDGDGVDDIHDSCPGTPAGAEVDEFGCDG